MSWCSISDYIPGHLTSTAVIVTVSDPKPRVKTVFASLGVEKPLSFPLFEARHSNKDMRICEFEAKCNRILYTCTLLGEWTLN